MLGAMVARVQGGGDVIMVIWKCSKVQVAVYEETEIRLNTCVQLCVQRCVQRYFLIKCLM